MEINFFNENVADELTSYIEQLKEVKDRLSEEKKLLLSVESKLQDETDLNETLGLIKSTLTQKEDTQTITPVIDNLKAIEDNTKLQNLIILGELVSLNGEIVDLNNLTRDIRSNLDSLGSQYTTDERKLKRASMIGFDSLLKYYVDIHYDTKIISLDYKNLKEFVTNFDDINEVNERVKAFFNIKEKTYLALFGRFDVKDPDSLPTLKDDLKYELLELAKVRLGSSIDSLDQDINNLETYVKQSLRTTEVTKEMDNLLRDFAMKKGFVYYSPFNFKQYVPENQLRLFPLETAKAA
ncbi:MAG: hypothetical protein WC413_00905 [Candidatus Nanoarchaeia archaeon]